MRSSKARSKRESLHYAAFCIPFSGSSLSFPFRFNFDKLEHSFHDLWTTKSEFTARSMFTTKLYIVVRCALLAIGAGLSISQQPPTEQQLVIVGVQSVLCLCVLICTCVIGRKSLVFECSVVTVASFYISCLFLLPTKNPSMSPVDFNFILLCSCWVLHSKNWARTIAAKLTLVVSVSFAFVAFQSSSSTSNLRLPICILLFTSIALSLFYHLNVQWGSRNAYYRIGYAQYESNRIQSEGKLIKRLIDSIMPRKISEQIMCDLDKFRANLGTGFKSIEPDDPVSSLTKGNQQQFYEDDTTQFGSEKDGQHSTVLVDIERPFVVRRMHNVSILFADIVGFTRMSSNKTANQLVSLLGDLYGRFDSLCTTMNCEKIATLGDCYYCVSGCPDERPDHANAAINMGLAMINEVRRFDAERAEHIQMRVGIHTGSVNCGILGVHKFKFDIFSHDVTLANHLESTGKPGFVHITECTFNSIEDTNPKTPFVYNIQPADSVNFQGNSYQTFMISSDQQSNDNQIPPSNDDQMIGLKNICGTGSTSVLGATHCNRNDSIYHRCHSATQQFERGFLKFWWKVSKWSSATDEDVVKAEESKHLTKCDECPPRPPLLDDQSIPMVTACDQSNVAAAADCIPKLEEPLSIDQEVYECLAKCESSSSSNKLRDSVSRDQRQMFHECTANLSKYTLRFKAHNSSAADYEAKFARDSHWRSGISNVDTAAYINLSQSSVGSCLIHALALSAHLTIVSICWRWIMFDSSSSLKLPVILICTILLIGYACIAFLLVVSLRQARTGRLASNVHTMRRCVQPLISHIYLLSPVFLAACISFYTHPPRPPLVISCLLTPLMLHPISAPYGHSVISANWIVRSIYLALIYTLLAVSMLIQRQQQHLKLQHSLSAALTFEVLSVHASFLAYLVFYTRRFEILQRVYVYTRSQQYSEKVASASEKERADWLLHNVIPSFVIQPLIQRSLNFGRRR